MKDEIKEAKQIYGVDTMVRLSKQWKRSEYAKSLQIETARCDPALT